MCIETCKYTSSKYVKTHKYIDGLYRAMVKECGNLLMELLRVFKHTIKEFHPGL